MRILFLAASLTLAVAARAAPATPESIDELLRLTRAEAILETMYANMDQLMRQAMAESLKGQKLTAEQQRALEAAPARFGRVIRDEMSWEKLRPVYVQIYQQSFTQEEIDALTAFYRTPAGAAFVTKMPAAMQRSIGALQSRMGPLMEKMKVAVDQALAESGVKPR